ncbi:MAG: hypothetical protein KC561_00125 [Myxococcales bacterium]|nr:hypothetical protein [Myxococcales bacterium]
MTTKHALLTAVLVGLTLVACGDKVTLEERVPEALIDTVEADGDAVAVYYYLGDLDRNDASVRVRYCLGGTCSTATAAPGGDGVANLPTDREDPVLHLFRWAALCDLTDTASEVTVEITPYDNAGTGPTVVTDPFSITGLGVSGECEDEL